MVAADFGLGAEIKLNDWEKEQLREAFMASMSKEKASLMKEENTMLYDNYDPVAVMARKILAHKAGVGWTTWAHTGIPVPVMAKGTGQQLFDGWIDNTDIPRNIALLLDLPEIK
jgi:alkaline phosphatase